MADNWKERDIEFWAPFVWERQRQCSLCNGYGWYETKPQNDYVPEQIECDECRKQYGMF